MAGILNSKSRVLDVVLTELGRDQINRGEFNVTFVTFSDKGAQYIDGGDGVADRIDSNLYFETFSSPKDEIVPEISNDGDFVLTKQVTPELVMNNGVLFEKQSSGYQQVDGFENITAFTDITPSRWKDLQILRTESTVPNFELNRRSATIEHQEKTVPKTVNALKPILVDPRFTGTLNTLFLPPVSEINGELRPMRAYNRYGPDRSEKTILKDDIQKKSWGKQRFVLGDDSSFPHYNILGQAFMKKKSSVRKYLIVDAGEFLDEEGVPKMQIYHLGFVYKDEEGTSKFSRGFSIVFHKGDE